MKTKIAFLFLCASLFFYAHKAYACYTYSFKDTKYVNQSSGTISCSSGCATNSTTVWFVNVGSSERIRLEYTINMPVYAGNRVRIWQSISDHDCYECMGGGYNGCLILDTDLMHYGGFASGVLTTDFGGCFAVEYDLLNAGTNVRYTGLNINFSCGEVIPSNLHVEGAITATDLTVSGKVGIGVSQPQYPLQVNGTIMASNLRVDSITNYGSMYTDKISVGLPNNTPQAPLHVFDVDNTSTNRVIAIYEGNSIESLPYVLHRNNLVFRNTGGSTPAAMVFHDGLSSGPFTGLSSAQSWWERRAITDEQKWGYGTTTRMILKNGNLGIGIGDTIPTEKLQVAGNIKADTLKAKSLQVSGTTNFGSITTTGNVGIGMTTTPTESLEVNGKIKATNGLQLLSGSTLYEWGGSDGWLSLKSGGKTLLSATQGEVRIGANEGNTTGYGYKLSFLGATDNTDPLYIARYNNNNESDKTELRVSIGDDEDGYDCFTVGSTMWDTGLWKPYFRVWNSGTVEAKKVVLEDVIPADFVFAPDYKLPKLEAVEEHIKEKQHLPEIPSAAEIEEKGVDVAEMNMKLLQKIEELTLYVIDQNKRLSEQNEQIVNQNERISTLEKALKKK